MLATLALMSAPVACNEYRIIDGDTWACDGQKVRGFGIQAPEMDARKCRKIECIPGDPIAAKKALEAEFTKGRMTYRYRIKRDGSPQLDFYGRRQGIIYRDGKSGFCGPLKAGIIVHKPNYDTGGIVLKECGL